MKKSTLSFVDKGKRFFILEKHFFLKRALYSEFRMFSVWEVVGSSPPCVPVRLLPIYRLCLDMVSPLWEEPVASDSFFRRTGCFWKPQGLSGLQDQISWDQILQVASRSQKPLDFWHNGWLFFPLTQQGSSLPPSYLFAVSHVWCLAQAMVWIRLETSSCKTERTFLLLCLPLKSEKRLRRISFQIVFQDTLISRNFFERKGLLRNF